MTTDFLTFSDQMTVEETLAELRRLKPEPVNLYTIFVIDRNERLLSSIPLGDLVISDPVLKLKDVVRAKPVSVFDDDKKDSLAELVSKYNLLAVPVINREMKMEGMVVVEDIVEDLLKKRKTK
jgi:Mg/Co/Ni transporter MgtE